MTQAPTRNERYLSDFRTLQDSVAANGPDWLKELRQRAWERFDALGFPTARRGNERWKYTNVAAIARGEFGFTAGNTQTSELSFGLPRIFAAPVVERDSEDAVRQHLGSLASIDDDGFTALNTAFLRDVAFVEVPDGQEAAVCINHVGGHGAAANGTRAVTHPRTLIVAGRNTNLTVVERYVGSGDNIDHDPTGERAYDPDQGYFTNAVTEVVVEEGANVDHYRVLREDHSSFHVGTTRVVQGRDSSYTSGSFSMGNRLARHNMSVLLDAPGCYCSLNGLYHTTGRQHTDNLVNIDHAKPHGTSRLNYKGILDGRSRAVFGGEVLVRENAQKSDAQQTDKNLLLSEGAEVDSKPSLLIYADDVKCSHGATSGHFGEDTLFYLRSRGLDLEAASRMLVHAFASEIIDSVRPEPLREHLDTLFNQAIPKQSLSFGRRI